MVCWPAAAAAAAGASLRWALLDCRKLGEGLREGAGA